MKRRTFLQLSGMAAASSVLAGCRKGNEKLIPFLVPPEDGAIPGKADYYASTCRQCPAGCGLLARVSAGRVRKIEGNPQHPVNRGKLCARGQAVVQELYHPDRLRGPLQRSGPRGSGQFEPISWNAALARIAEQLTPADSNGSEPKTVLMTPPLQGYLADLVARFGRGYRQLQHVAWEPLAPEWRRQSLFGHQGVLDYDLENTQYLLSFGADFLESHLSPVRFGHAFGKMRQGRPTVRGRFSYIGPRLSLTAASADRWLPARPGSEFAIALAMARQLLPQVSSASLNAAGIDAAELERLLAPYSVAHAAELTGVGAADIAAAVTEVTTIRPALAIAGEMLTAQANGPEALRAVELLNLLLDSVNTRGGLYLSQLNEPVAASSRAELQDAITTLQNGACQLLWLQGVNPAFNFPQAVAFTEALKQVPLVACCSTLLDDTARQADLILPEHANLESWGEVIPTAGYRGRTVGLMQGVVKPLYDTRPFADVLIALARALGGELDAAIPEASSLAGLQGRHAPGDPVRWNALLAQGGIFDSQPATPVPLPKVTLPSPQPLTTTRDQDDSSLLLQIYPSPNFYDGRNAALPWLQQLPDPMTTAVWGSWLEINPQTAARLGIAQGDLVEVRSEAGALQVPAVLYPGIHPDMLAMPLGQGHTGLGRYADDRGRNPLQLAGPLEANDGAPALAVIPVRLTRLGAAEQLVTAGHPEGSYRRELLGI
jgi:anaerobic selenocysteine-containing dehydrogenase